jgi:multimeric flavodoxin WrbA
MSGGADRPVTVLGIAGGPREGGNSEQLLDAVLAGAEAAGAGVEKVRAADLAMEGCRECGGCDRTGRCVVEDDMQALYDRLLAAEAVVFATPIFFMGVASQGKRIIDRAQALWVRRHRLKEDPRRPGRKGLFIATAGGSSDKVFDGARDTVKAFFAEVGVAWWGELVARPLEGPNEARAVSGLFEKADALGRALAERRPFP